MSEKELWARIKSVSDTLGITDVNFRQMKSQERLPEKWVTRLYFALETNKVPPLLKKLHELSQRNDD